MMLHTRTTCRSGQQRLDRTRSAGEPMTEAKLLSPAAARSGSGICIDGFRPVVFKIEQTGPE